MIEDVVKSIVPLRASCSVLADRARFNLNPPKTLVLTFPITLLGRALFAAVRESGNVHKHEVLTRAIDVR